MTHLSRSVTVKLVMRNREQREMFRHMSAKAKQFNRTKRWPEVQGDARQQYQRRVGVLSYLLYELDCVCPAPKKMVFQPFWLVKCFNLS